MLDLAADEFGKLGDKIMPPQVNRAEQLLPFGNEDLPGGLEAHELGSPSSFSPLLASQRRVVKLYAEVN